MITLEAGKSYVNSNGIRRCILGPVREHSGWVWSLQGDRYEAATGKRVFYSKAGGKYYTDESPENLVAEIEDPDCLKNDAVMTYQETHELVKEIFRRGALKLKKWGLDPRSIDASQPQYYGYRSSGCLCHICKGRGYHRNWIMPFWDWEPGEDCDCCQGTGRIRMPRDPRVENQLLLAAEPRDPRKK